MKIRVSSLSGPEGKDRPDGFQLGKTRIPVRDLLDEWPGEDYRYVKFLGEDGAIYILRQDFTTLDWELILYDSRKEHL